jgi:endonuclease YncB( thermonuclease family)
MFVSCASLSVAAYPDATTTVGPATIHGCYDGDTCTISIPTLPGIFGDRLSLRLAGIDTPEMKGKCDQEKLLASQAKTFLTQHLEQAHNIEIELVARDKYFRVLALIVADGLDLADEMVKAGLANAYGGGTKHRWCPKRGPHEPVGSDAKAPQGAIQ